MKVNDPNLSTTSAAAAHASETARAKAASTARGANAGARTDPTSSASSGALPGALSGALSNDDVHLSELVRSLRSLASDSPERQAKIEGLTRAYADGAYRVDAEATASAIIREITGQPSPGPQSAGRTAKS